MHKVVLVFVLVIFGVVSSSNLAGYFTKCKKSSPDFGECLLHNAVVGVTKIAKAGSPKLKLNSLSPVVIEKIDLQATPSLKVVLNDAKFYGFDTIKFDNIVLSDTELKIDTQIDKLSMISKYDINGQILVLPIQGVGDCNITSVNVKLLYSAKLGIVEKDGDQHYEIKDAKLILDPQRVYWQLDNLFNGDKTLGAEMNKFLNEGWKEVFAEVRGAMTGILSSIFTTYVSAYFDAVPISELVE